MDLYIAEKPSLGRAIADNLPGTQKKGDGFIQMSNGDVVTWAAGHLYELAPPDHYTAGKNAFSMEVLPIIPETWVLQPRMDPKTKSQASAKKQLNILKDLISKATKIHHVGDPDREGEAIINNILVMFKNKKPVDRVWLNAMDPASVKKALANQKSDSDPLYVGMYQAALARSRADWLVGMNLSPAFTFSARRSAFNGTISIGRVQTPTLGLVVARDLEIENFKPVDYFTVSAEISVAKGKFTGKYKIPENMPGLDSEGRIANKKDADAIAARVQGQQGSITKYETKRDKELAPLPFSLSTLQIYASSKFGYGAQQVLDTCQALYETHALTSYPRTDCEFLPESQHGDGPGVLGHLAKNFGVAAGANASIKSRVFNDKKVTAHHAIIPTGKAANLANLSKIERDLYEAISMRYIANFYPDYVFDKTNVEATFGTSKDVFTASGRVDVSQGWRAVLPAMGKKGAEDEATLPAAAKGDPAKADKTKVDAKQTTPPSYFTEGTLIEAMTNVHKFVTNPEIKKRLKEVAGIGTEATRAGILERLFKREFLVKEGKKIKSSGAARALIAAVPSVVKDPGMTALWEGRMESIIDGSLTLDQFMHETGENIKKLINWSKENTINIDAKFSTGGKGGSGGGGYKGGGKGGYKSGGKGGCKSSGNGGGGGFKPAQIGKGVILDVPFDDKDKAKALGARWSGEKKAWFVPEGTDTSPFSQWMPKKGRKP